MDDWNSDVLGSQKKKARCACCWSMRTQAILWTVLGALLLAFGLAAVPAIDSIMASVIAKDVAISSTSSQFYPLWSNSSKVPMYMTFYMFNLTNPAAVLQGAKPYVEVVGPFNYLETRIKHNPKWSPDNTRLTYTYTRIFQLLSTRCPPGVLYPTVDCSLKDDMNITTVNIPLMTLASLFGELITAAKEADQPLLADFAIAALNDLIATYNTKTGNLGTLALS